MPRSRRWRDACAETRNNRLLPCVLKTCLDVGNYLNAGHRAGAAAGFQIESLLKLKAVRSSKHPGRTLLHFVARQVLSSSPVIWSDLNGPIQALVNGVWASCQTCSQDADGLLDY